MFSDKPIDFDRFVRMLLGAGVLVAIYFLLQELSSVLLPFLLAWLTAYLLNPSVELVKRLVKKRAIAASIVLVLLSGFSALFLLFFLPMAKSEILDLQYLIQNQLERAEFPAWIPQDIWSSALVYLKNIDFAKLAQEEQVQEKAADVINGSYEILKSIFGAIGSLFSVVTYLLYLIFIMLDYESIAEDWKKFVPEKYKSFIFKLVADLEEGMNGYFRAQTNIVIVVAILFAIGFKLVGLPFAIMLGIILGIMNYIPYLQLVGLVPAIALAGLKALETGDSFWMILGLTLLVFVVVQFAQDIYLTPKFMGDFSGFNPAIILLSLSIWGSLLGMIGLILAIPLTSILIAYYRRYVVKSTEIGKN